MTTPRKHAVYGVDKDSRVAYCACGVSMPEAEIDEHVTQGNAEKEAPARDDSAVLAQYRETLHAWAARHVPEGARVTDVTINYDDGYDPTFTDRPASLTASVRYAAPAGVGDLEHVGITGGTAEVLTSMGELLTALFAIEEFR